MKLLHVHNFYQQSGGEDRVFATDYKVLTSNGHEVIQYTKDNYDIGRMSKIALVKNTLWNNQTYQDIEQLIMMHHPDVCHFHNTFPLISPSVYYACQKYNIPVVQRLPNYRLICPNALLFRNGKICYDCVGKYIPWPGVWYACYRNSHVETAVVCSMLLFHRCIKTWKKQVDVFIALTEYSKNLFITGGLPGEKITISPNIVEPDPGQKISTGDFVLFVGRLSREKGLITLLDAWRGIPDVPLYIIGDGPLKDELRSIIDSHQIQNVTLMGRKPNQEVFESIKRARFLIFPSEWSETFGMSIIEAYACGVPVIAANQSTTREIIDDNITGYLFEPGNSMELAVLVKTVWDDLDKIKRMGIEARNAYEHKYSKEQKYKSLMQIYELAIHNNRSK